MNEVITIGVDLAKNVFQVHGVDAEGTGFRPGGRCAGSLQAGGVSQAPSRQHW